MSFLLSHDYVDEEITNNIYESCTKKMKLSQFEEEAKSIECFEVTDTDVIIPIGLWDVYYDKFPNVIKKSMRSNFKFNKTLYTLETDPKHTRDQDVVVKEALKILKKSHSVFLQLFTGFGKTNLEIYCISKLGCKALHLCGISKVNKRTCKDIRENTTAKVQIVTKKLDPTADIYIMGITKASKYTIEDFKDIGTVVVDEAHMWTETCFSKVLLKLVNCVYFIAMTASPKRPGGENELYEPYVRDRYIERFEVKDFIVIKYKTKYKPKIEYMIVKGKSMVKWTTVVGSLSENIERRNEVLKLVKRHADKCIMIMSNRKAQNHYLLKLLEENDEDVDGLFDDKDEYREDCRILIVGTKKGGVGFDDVSRDMLILLDDFKDVNQYEGRIRQANGLIYDFVDNYNTLEKHWELREQWYIKRGATIKYEGNISEIGKKRLLPRNSS